MLPVRRGRVQGDQGQNGGADLVQTALRDVVGRTKGRLAPPTGRERQCNEGGSDERKEKNKQDGREWQKEDRMNSERNKSK